MEYYTIFLFVLNILLLTVLVYSLMTAMKDHKCVFGIKCCPTNLENTVHHPSDYHVPLTYGPSPVHSSLKDPETIKFEYHDSRYNDGPCFFKLHIHYNSLPTAGTNYPSNIGPCSSYELSSTTDRGGSVYLKYYQNNTQFWDQSYKVVNKTIEEIIKQINVEDSTIDISSHTINSGFKYQASWFTRGGKTQISSNSTGSSPSYFSQFNKSKKLNLNSKATDPTTYNPMTDWFDFKLSIKKGSSTNHCELNPKMCKCIDPGAKQLPPCTDADFHPHQGYPVSTGGFASNCSRSLTRNPQSLNIGEALISNHSLAGTGNGTGKTAGGFVSCNSGVGVGSGDCPILEN